MWTSPAIRSMSTRCRASRQRRRSAISTSRFRLRAGSLHIARVGETEIDSGSLALNLAKSGPNVALKRLSVAGLDGASLDVEGAHRSRLDCGDGSLASRPAARFRGAGFASCAGRLEPDAGRAGWRAFAGGADLRRSRRGGRRWRRSRHRFAQGQWIGRRNAVLNHARSATERRRSRSYRQPRFAKLGRAVASAWRATPRRREAGARASRSTRAGDGRRVTTSMRPRSSRERISRGAAASCRWGKRRREAVWVRQGEVAEPRPACRRPWSCAR